MPRGFEGVREASQDIAARASAGGAGGLYFKLGDGDSAIVRFLEESDEVAWSWCHQLEPEGGRSWGRKVPCRDQDELGNQQGEPCPGCEHPNEEVRKRKFTGWINMIWRDAPKAVRDSEGRVRKDANGKVITDGVADQIATWESGITVFEELDGKDVTYKGLTSRDWRITRKGSGLKTTYVIEPADPDGGPKSMSVKDKALAKEKNDYTSRVTAPSYESYFDKPGKEKQEDEDSAPVSTSPFKRTEG